MPPHAPCRLQRFINSTDEIEVHLCLHTLRADCNVVAEKPRWINVLCLHTLRADCNGSSLFPFTQQVPFASTRSVQIATACRYGQYLVDNFASTRSVQIATAVVCFRSLSKSPLPPHAPCRLQLHVDMVNILWITLPPHAPCRLQRQKCTELQYALFRTCVESVDSFSVLNKSMLR